MPPQLDRIEAKINETHASVEKMRKYMLWGFWITVAVIVIPLFILPLFLPSFLASQGLGAGL